MVIPDSTIAVILLLLAFVITALLVHIATKLPEINSRTFKMEHMLNMLGNNMQLGRMETEFNKTLQAYRKMRGGRAIFRTSDGKYVAKSLGELLEKISRDPESNMSTDELINLKKIFDQISSEIEEDDDEPPEE
jgi:hypothetical protein